MLDLKQIIGHEDIIKHFRVSIKNNTISHAYLISGQDDSGKMTLANGFAMALQCENIHSNINLEDIDSCGECHSCKQFQGNNHPDIIYVTHEKASIGVDDIRKQVNEDIIIKPYSSKYKIYIIDEAEKLTVEAQNALLKTLEEPPEYAIIILLSNNINRILETIQSRCIILHIRAVDSNVIKNYLMSQYKVPDYQAELSAVFAQGNVGKAISFSSNEDFANTRDQVIRLLKNIKDMDNYEIIDTINKLTKERKKDKDSGKSKSKDDILNILDLIILWYRDILMYKVTKNPNILLYKKEITFISKKGKTISYEGIQNVLKAVEEAKSKINANVNTETTLELMLFTIKENING